MLSVLLIVGFGVDFVCGLKMLSLIKEYGFFVGKMLFVGVVDGCNIWVNDLVVFVGVVEEL